MFGSRVVFGIHTYDAELSLTSFQSETFFLTLLIFVESLLHNTCCNTLAFFQV